MKKIATLFVLLSAFHFCFCQSIERELIGVNGTTLSNGGYQLSYSIGEVVTKSSLAPSNSNPFFITVGFQQPLVAKAGQILAVNDWVSAYPNPAVTKVRLDIHGINSESNRVQVFNVAGQSVVAPFTFINGSIDIDISRLAAGVYIIKVADKFKERSVSAAIIKQNQ